MICQLQDKYKTVEYMKNSNLAILFCIVFFSANSFAQKGKQIASAPESSVIKIPMEPFYWEYDSSTTEFVNYKNTSVVKGKNGNGFQVFLKNQNFVNGTIEFDVELSGMGFPGINFRMSEDRKNGENFYIRSFGPVLPETRTTLQYAAIIGGVSIWDLSDEYQAGAIIHQNKWNHVKLVVSGKQMWAYVNDMNKPALVVPELEGWRDSGGISLSGNVIFSNLVIKPAVTGSLNPLAGYASTYSDTRYLRNWMVSPEKDFPFGRDLIIPLPSMFGKLKASDLPDSSTQWTHIKAESRGIVNLTRIYGMRDNDTRRITWLKTAMYSDKAQERTLSFGFSDEVWIFLNGQILYADKNYFGTPQQKQPAGRCTIENASIKLSLLEGKNEIMIALANYFYGWGIVARLDDMSGIQIEKSMDLKAFFMNFNNNEAQGRNICTGSLYRSATGDCRKTEYFFPDHSGSRYKVWQSFSSKDFGKRRRCTLALYNYAGNKTMQYPLL
jgi:hypothetical protein